MSELYATEVKSLALAAMLGLGIVVIAAAPLSTPPTVAALAARLDNFSASDVVDELESSGRYDGVLAHIASGSKDWVALAPLLAPGTDASSTQGLGVSLARALPLNPATVLRVVAASSDAATGLDMVCGLPFLDGTRAGIERYRRRTLAVLSHVRDKDVLAVRDRCSALMKSR